MKKIFKKSAIALTMLSVSSTAVFAVAIESPIVGSNTGIQGFQPYMKSIGTQVVSGGIDDNGNVLAAVGAVIEVPTYMPSQTLFDFADMDGDIAAGLGYATLPDGSPATKEFRIEWYALEPKAGDWASVSSWDDVNAEIIETEKTPTNLNSDTLIVPESAIGKRLGFIAYPESEYGQPSLGVPIKAWDLSKLWTQTPPKNPGQCSEGDPDCSNTGEPGGENPNGGGGEVQSVDWAINIYDEVTQTLVKTDTPLLVDHTYFATIRILDETDPSGKTFREPTSDELQTIQWHIVNTADQKSIATYGVGDSTRVDISSGETYGPEKFVKYTFKTQKDNSEAKEPLNTTAPNFSEQGFGLKVSLDIK